MSHVLVIDAAVRRGRRSRHMRYRQPRWRNRRRPKGWLPPSLCSRVQNETWTRRLMRWCPRSAISYEAVRFDTQALQNPEIEGVVNTSFMMGGAPGLAILASLATARTNSLQGTGLDHLAALNGGYHVAFLVAALFAVSASDHVKPRRIEKRAACTRSACVILMI